MNRHLTFTTIVSLALALSACQQAGEHAGESVSASQNGSVSDIVHHDDAHAAAHGDDHAHGDVHEHDHEHDHGAPPQLAEGQLWATDAPLRAAMVRIRAAVEQHTPSYRQGTLQAAQAQALASAIEDDIDYMIANCKLEPEPDAALHVLIARMMNAATALKTDPMSETGLPQAVSALSEYGSTFDHPDWEPMS